MSLLSGMVEKRIRRIIARVTTEIRRHAKLQVVVSTNLDAPVAERERAMTIHATLTAIANSIDEGSKDLS